MDAPQGYHQLRVAKDSREKLAFQGPDAIKWAWNVMPFGPVNGPMIFTDFMHDMDSTWKSLARSRNIPIDETTNTRLIVDDLLSHAHSFELGLHYLECQLLTCRSQNLSLKLSKCHWFPEQLEFVGLDVTRDGNRPARSKHQLLSSWPTPTIVRDVASFVGFAVFYSKYIPLFEIHVVRLRELMKDDYATELGNAWDSTAQHEFDDIWKALLTDPCLKRFDHRKRLYLLTDFCKDGFGYCATQPGDDEASIAAMNREMSGAPCEFLTRDSNLTLHPVALGCPRTRGNETRLYSHLGEGFAGDWAINKCRHMAWGMLFTWITDCYALCFILSYDGNNPAILRLQMRLMCWAMTIVHSPGDLNPSDYFSRLSADLYFDPFLKDYVQRVAALKQANPAHTKLPMQPENMPGYWYKTKQSSSQADVHALNLISAIYVENDGHQQSTFYNMPVSFGSYPADINLESVHKCSPLYNSEIVQAARTICHQHWAIYSFNSGHFVSSIENQSLPFDVVLAADPFLEGRSLFKQFTACSSILTGAKALYDHIRRSGDRSKLDGYLLHSHRLPSSSATRTFWQLQGSKILELRKIRALSIFVAFVHPDHDGRPLSLFIRLLKDNGWVMSDSSLYFPEYHDSVASSGRVIIGARSETDSNVIPVVIPRPPEIHPPPLSAYLWRPFNTVDHSISLARSSPDFSPDNESDEQLIASDAVDLPGHLPHPFQCKPLYCLHHRSADTSVQYGSMVMSTSNLCPPFSPTRTQNVFGHYFGIEYCVDGEMYVRPISPFEFVQCFNLGDELTYQLSHKKNMCYMDAAIPAYTSGFIFQACYDRLVEISNANLEIYEPSQTCAPAAMNNVFVNGVTATKLPNQDAWVKAYEDDPQTQLIVSMLKIPGLIVKSNLSKVHPSLRMPLRQSTLVLEDDIIILREPLGGGSNSYCKFRLVPESLRNIVFIAFHANPIGGHLNFVRTYRNIRLCYFWPEMYSYCKSMCAKCPACALANRTMSPAAELQYGFPTMAPMMVLHVDGYQSGAHANFDDESTYCITCCGMTVFTVT